MACSAFRVNKIWGRISACNFLHHSSERKDDDGEFLNDEDELQIYFDYFCHWNAVMYSTSRFKLVVSIKKSTVLSIKA